MVQTALAAARQDGEEVASISTQYLHIIYSLSTHYLLNIYTLSTHYLHRWGDREIQRFLERNYDMTMRKIELPTETEQLLVPAPVGARELELEEAAEVEEAENNHLLSTKVFC